MVGKKGYFHKKIVVAQRETYDQHTNHTMYKHKSTQRIKRITQQIFTWLGSMHTINTHFGTLEIRN